MNKLITGLIAGFAATVVLSVLMLVKGMMGLMPDVNMIDMLARQMGSGPLIGWCVHLMIGIIGYGLVYAVVFDGLAIGGHITKGILLGTLGWLLMMVILMPMMGAGIFGLQMPSGVMVPVVTLMLHWIFGLVLGLSYAKLSR
ncbi:MAG: hypothetical protein RQ982_10445 [Gammaproteobacteria bacterium]|nr:hypothetical protein [Gammaproteobacteria bacterium]